MNAIKRFNERGKNQPVASSFKQILEAVYVIEIFTPHKLRGHGFNETLNSTGYTR